MLCLDLVRLLEFRLEPIDVLGSSGRYIVVTMYQCLQSTFWMMKYTGVSPAPLEAHALKMKAERFLPALGCVPSSVQAKPKLAHQISPRFWIFSWQLDIYIAIDLRVEVRASHIAHDDLPPLLRWVLSRGMTHHNSKSFKWRGRGVQSIVLADVELSSN